MGCGALQIRLINAGQGAAEHYVQRRLPALIVSEKRTMSVTNEAQRGIEQKAPNKARVRLDSALLVWW